MAAVEIIGSSLAAMVCADVLHRQGVPVALRCDPRELGRAFRGFEVDGVRLEVGARLLELDYGDPPAPDPDPRGYEFGEHRWHMGLIREYLLGLVNPLEVKLWIDRDGRTSPDFLLSSNLVELPAACSRFELGKIEREALAAANVIGFDGIDQRTLGSMTYRDASVALHGWAFHRAFIEPLLEAILGPGGDLPALDHRRVWLPLFAPGEVLEACRGQSTRPVRKVYMGMAAAVEVLAIRVEPLLGASLPNGPVNVVRDATRTVDRAVDLRFIWAQNPRPADPAVVWRIGSPLFRVTQFGRVLCWEMAGSHVALKGQTHVVADRVIPYALAESGWVDCHDGLIGIGSMNENIIQGIAAAAWRMGER